MIGIFILLPKYNIIINTRLFPCQSSCETRDFFSGDNNKKMISSHILAAMTLVADRDYRGTIPWWSREKQERELE